MANSEPGPPEPLQERTVSTLLRDDSMNAAVKNELEAWIALVQAGSTMSKVTNFMFRREHERYVAVCPHTAQVYWMKPPRRLWLDTVPEARPGPVCGVLDAAIFDRELAKIDEYKSDKLVGAVPATLKHVSSKDKDRGFVLIAEQNELVLLVKDAEAQRFWLAACSAIVGRSRDAMVLAGMQAITDKRGAAEKQLADAATMEAAAARAKLKAEAEAKAAQAQAEAETTAAKAKAKAEAEAVCAKAEAEAEAAKAEAEAEVAAARARAEAEATAAKEQAEAELVAARQKDEEALKEGQEQLHQAIVEHGGEKLKLGKARECCVCFEEYYGFKDGVSCKGKKAGAPHFVCNACFVASVQSAITDEMSKQAMREGRVPCPYATYPASETSCDAPCFHGKVVAEKVDEKLFGAYQRQRDRLTEAKCATEQQKAMDERLELAIKKMEKEGLNVFKARKFIEEDVLTMHCPRCKMAFADWDGCNALYCTYAGCGCNFCAFCLKDCGGGVAHGEAQIRMRGNDPVHQHIAKECKYAKGIGVGGAGKERLKKEVWGRVRTDRILDCLRDKCENRAEQQKVIDALAQQFAALGLDIQLPEPADADSGSKVKAGAKVGAKSTVKPGKKVHTPPPRRRPTPGRPRRRAEKRKGLGVRFSLRMEEVLAKELEKEGLVARFLDDAGEGVEAGGAEAAMDEAAEAGAAGGGKGGAGRKGRRRREAPLQLPAGIKACPACGMLIEKVGGDDHVMCGCAAKVAGGTYEKALKGGGCGHEFNFVTLAPLGGGALGRPLNARQRLFFLDESEDGSSDEEGRAQRLARAEKESGSEVDSDRTSTDEIGLSSESEEEFFLRSPPETSEEESEEDSESSG